MDLSHNILSLLTWLPIFGGVAVLLGGDGGDSASSRAAGMRSLSLAVSVLTFVLSIFLYTNFDTTTASMQFVERAPWIGALNVEYFLGVDGISAPLILLTTFITPLIIVAGWDSIKERPAQYFAAFLILEGLMIGVFSALDGVLFYVFWEIGYRYHRSPHRQKSAGVRPASYRSRTGCRQGAIPSERSTFSSKDPA